MRTKVLITGGAGFIGSHLADELLEHGYDVRALDNLSPQVHGDDASRPDYLSPDVELMVGDVRDAASVRLALEGVDAVFHLAASVGVGQSMYAIESYTSVNNIGTAVLLEGLLKHPVPRLIVASSMSIYGEGMYRDADGRTLAGTDRPLQQLRLGRWELNDTLGRPLTPVPTTEDKPPALTSVYALSKYDQERLVHIYGRAYGTDTVALRFFNVYGTRQALSNPYTGVLAIFAARYLNDRRPVIFEDGHQRRDFVSVYDVARACRLALEIPNAAGYSLNIGSGHSVSVLEIARKMGALLGKSGCLPEVTGKYRAGDIRHCFADTRLAGSVLGYEAQVSLDEGMEELAEWLEGRLADDRLDRASAELTARGLTV